MNIDHFGGEEIAADAATLEAVLGKRYGANANEFWLSGEEPYPAVTILVREQLACVHFFPEDGHPGYLLKGGRSIVEPSGFTTFFTNTPTEEIEVANENIVPFSDAQRIAREFFLTNSMPGSDDWFEL